MGLSDRVGRFTSADIVLLVKQIDDLREDCRRIGLAEKMARSHEEEWRRSVALVQQSLAEESRLTAEWEERAIRAEAALAVLRMKSRKKSRKKAR